MNSDSVNGKLITSFLAGALVATVIISTLFLVLGKAASKSNNTTNTSTVSEILNHKWYLRASDGSKEAFRAYIIFNKDGSAGGNGGCNQFGSKFSTNQNTISITELFSTEIYCDDTSVGESEFFKGLTSATTFEVKDKTLLLKTPTKTLTFNRYENSVSEIVGKWELVKFVEGSTKTAKVADRETSLTFRPDGQVFGVACNNFGGSYKAETSTGIISVSNLTTTDMYCGPDKFMEQEAKLFDSLNSATKFEIENGELRIYYGTDKYIELSKTF